MRDLGDDFVSVVCVCFGMKMWVLLEFDFPVMCVDRKEKKKNGQKIEKEEEKDILVI